MKFLGTIIKTSDEEFLSLIDFPIGITGIVLPANIVIGYSENTGSIFTVSEYRLSRKRLHIRLKQTLSSAQIVDFKEMGVFIDEGNILFEDENESYFISDLIGCEVYSTNEDEYIGEIVDVYTMPANDVWVVRTNEGDLPVPAVKEFIIDINMEQKKIIIEMHEGLSDLIEPK